METLIAVLVGVLIGAVVISLYKKITIPVMGTLKIDESKPENIFMIEIKDVEAMMTRKQVNLKVTKVTNLVSMKDSVN